MAATTVLPEREDMAERLKSVLDVEHIVQHFHPRILIEAGKEMAAKEISEMITYEIQKFVASDAGRESPLAVYLVHTHIKEYISSIVDDEVVRAEALQLIANN